MRDPDEYDALGGAAKGASAGAMAGPWGAVIGGVAGAATPFLSKALGGLFGVDDAENAEKASLSSLRRVADGGTTQGQAGMAYARGRALQAMQSGSTPQQREQGMQLQAQYASQLADLRSREQERAASQVAFIEGRRAAAEAARKRAALSGAMESAVGMGTKLGMAAGSPGPKKPLETLDIGDQSKDVSGGAGGFAKWAAGNAAYDPTVQTRAAEAATVAATRAAAPSPEAQPFQLDLGQQAGVIPYQPVVPMLPGALTQPTMLQPSPAAQARMSDPFPNVAPAANIFQKATPSAFAQKQAKALKADPYAIVRNRTPQVDFGNYGTAFIDDEGEAKVPGYKPRKNSAGGMGL